MVEPRSFPQKVLTTPAVPLALFTGLVLPTLIAATWGDAMGGYIWAGLVSRVLGKSFTPLCSNFLTIFSMALYFSS